MADDAPGTTRSFDAVAAAFSRQRLARALQPPWLHGEVARRMGERVELIRVQPKLILDWGSFLGASVPVLETAYPNARKVLVEPDLSLLARSRDAVQRPWWSRRRRLADPADVLSDSGVLPHDAQLVWSNMALHGVADPPALFARWHELLAIDGFVMFSCLGPDTLRELRALYARLGWPSPTAPFIDMHDLGDMLLAAGFADPVMDQELLTLHWERPSALLDELRSLGGNTSPYRFTGLRTPRWRDRLLAELESLRGADGRLRLSFEIAYGHAFKAAPRVRAGAPTAIPLADMRSMLKPGRSSMGGV